MSIRFSICRRLVVKVLTVAFREERRELAWLSIIYWHFSGSTMNDEYMVHKKIPNLYDDSKTTCQILFYEDCRWSWMVSN